MNATRTRRRTVTAAAAALLAVPALSACGVSFGAQTDQPYQPGDGVIERSGSVDVLNALVVSDGPGTGRLVAGLSNSSDEDDELTGVIGAGEDDSVSYELGEGSTTIPANGFVDLSDEDVVLIEVTGSEEAVIPGQFLRLTLQFENADDVTVNVPVLEHNEDYEDVQMPSEATTGSPSASPTESPSASPTESTEE